MSDIIREQVEEHAQEIVWAKLATLLVEATPTYCKDTLRGLASVISTFERERASGG